MRGERGVALDTQHPRSKVESRKPEREGTKSEPRKDNATGMQKEVSGGPLNKSEERENPKAFDQLEDHVRRHHDRLQRIEDHLGLEKPSAGLKAEDQKESKHKDIAGDSHVRKGVQYSRKRH